MWVLYLFEVIEFKDIDEVVWWGNSARRDYC